MVIFSACVANFVYIIERKFYSRIIDTVALQGIQSKYIGDRDCNLRNFQEMDRIMDSEQIIASTSVAPATQKG